MIDREKVITVLRRRFPGSPPDQVAAAANAIVGLGDEWEPVETTDLTELLDRLRHGHEFRLLERRAATDVARPDGSMTEPVKRSR